MSGKAHLELGPSCPDARRTRIGLAHVHAGRLHPSGDFGVIVDYEGDVVLRQEGTKAWLAL